MRRADLLRITDANLNRAREGLRVCEEVVRFALGERSGARGLKAARHGVTRAMGLLGVSASELLAARDSRGDVGREPSTLESRRTGAPHLFLANAQRAKEALRVLEESSKALGGGKAWRLFKELRFDLYDIEKRTLPKLEAVYDRGSLRGGARPASGSRRARRGRRRSAKG